MSNQFLGYITLFAGVAIGWALCWLWKSVRDRRGVKPIDHEIHNWQIPDYWGTKEE